MNMSMSRPSVIPGKARRPHAGGSRPATGRHHAVRGPKNGKSSHVFEPVTRQDFLVEQLYERYRNRGSRAQRALHGSTMWLARWRNLAQARGGTVLKRTIDIVLALVILVPTVPVMLAVATAIWLTDGRPILHWQTRVGRDGHEFAFPKFRSMVINAEKLLDSLRVNSGKENDIRFKLRDDPRVTSIGRFIRKYSIDELPQLWCVLRGDMSIVGPRPPLPREVARYTLADRRRLEVTPGITCIWQISGRANIPFPEQVKLDTQYIETRSLWLDVVLLLRTVPAVLLARGAY